MGFSISFESCFTSTETVQTVRDGEPRTATSTFTQLLSSATQRIQCSFTSTETVRTIRGGEPRTTTSTFRTAPELWEFSIFVVVFVTLRPQRPTHKAVSPSALERRHTSTTAKTCVAHGNSHLPGVRVNTRCINSTRDTSPETIRSIRGREPRPSTSGFLHTAGSWVLRVLFNIWWTDIIML